MTGSNTGSDSRSAGSRNGIKDMADLAVALKPITCVKPSSQADIPADIQNLARRLKEVQGGRGVIPRDVFTKVQSSLGVIEPSLSDENVYDTDALRRTIRDDGQPTSWSAWDVDDEYNVLRRVAARTEECDIENVSEPSWNARVHEPLLDMALSTFRGSLSHWDVTRAIITRDYHLRRDAGPLKSKMVDFVITLDSTSVVAAAKDQIRLQGGSPRSINHTEYQPLRYRPIAISIETKPTNGSIDEGMTQLAVWSSAYMSRLKELSTTSDKAAAGVGIGVTLPLLLVRGSQWSLMMAVDQVREMKLLDFGVIGNTSTLVGCYKMVAQLRCFAEWSTTTFQEWILREALS